jgi:hypothetical protein
MQNLNTSMQYGLVTIIILHIMIANLKGFKFTYFISYSAYFFLHILLHILRLHIAYSAYIRVSGWILARYHIVRTMLRTALNIRHRRVVRLSTS